MEKRNKIIYWVATALLAFGMTVSGLQQLLQGKEMATMIAHLGYPAYFMTIIGVWKLLGVVVILLPGFKVIKEWAYAGFFFTMTGALISHLAIGDDGLKEIAGPVMQTVFIILSWYFRPADRKIGMAA
jgi:uncharacterized membrane protein